MRDWAKAIGCEELYDEYLEACEEIARECEAEGYPAHGENYDLRVAQLEKSFPELFGDDEEEQVGYVLGYCEDEVIG